MPPRARTGARSRVRSACVPGRHQCRRLSDSGGNQVALDQGLDICGLMDAGLSRQNMVSQFAADNPSLGPDGAAQVVRIAIRDLCPWHR